MKNQEVWVGITDYEGYEVSNLGRVRSLDRVISGGKRRTGKILKQHYNHGGYPYVSLYKNGKGRKITVHRIVAKSFIPNPDNKEEVNHIDGRKNNNSVDNLEWSTRLDNTRHSYSTNLNVCYGENHHQAKLTNDQVLEIYERVHKGEKGVSLAQEFGVYKSVISDIKRRKRWKHITGKLA
ncbi:NUMOD4 domain-containing protein [Lysinibacillus fusiformis]|uniref:NUMOD4 domain-containing protein n=1 Tax=Lysinibacillus fusiformis TaxID=28031 RepID=UPI0034E27550